ncbi:MAG: hypothetical protein MJA84_03545 [Firmicutes bacterium]|nr:hypothetical protein [Bacillota bacterium]
MKKPEEQFWEWFKKKSNQFYYFEKNQSTLFQSLKTELDKIDPNLVFEFSPILEDGKREFVISADGIRESFPSVINLANNAPNMDLWKIVAFRQPKKEVSQITYENLNIKLDDIFFKYGKNNGKIDLELNIRGFQESPEWTAAVFIILDNVLGEYDTEMNLSYIDKKELDEKEVNSLFPITDLPKIIHNYKLEYSN